MRVGASSISSAAAPPKGAVLSQQQLETDLIVNGVTPERAKPLFSVAIGPLPGVDIPAGFARDPTDFDGTPAITALYQVWNSLTPDQRRAAGHLLQRPASTVAEDTIVWGRLLPMFEHAIGGDSPAAFAELSALTLRGSGRDRERDSRRIVPGE
jgi:hypothetical protein